MFIIGAGASLEVGFPDGKKLTHQIAEKLGIEFDCLEPIKGSRYIGEAIRLHAQQQNIRNTECYINACWQIHDAMPLAKSIDTYVDAHGTDNIIKFCAKLAVSECILEAEGNSALQFNYDANTREECINLARTENAWLQPFFHLLNDGIPKENVQEIFENTSFIVFNYDRCLEHYLYHALQKYYSLNSEELITCLSKLKIFHPYGSVGSLPWQDQGLGIKFGSKPFSDTILRVAPHIQTFTEQIDTPLIKEIREIVRDAKIIVFLGFSFHDLNLKLLADQIQSKAQRVFATAYGISNTDTKIIEGDINKFCPSPSINIRNDLECSKLFDEYWRALSRT